MLTHRPWIGAEWSRQLMFIAFGAVSGTKARRISQANREGSAQPEPRRAAGRLACGRGGSL